MDAHKRKTIMERLSVSQLAFFLGCELGRHEPNMHDLSETILSKKKLSINTLSLLEDGILNGYQPILRPLSYMTNDEAIHITKLALNIHHNTDLTNETYFSFTKSDKEVKIKAHYYNTMLESYDDDIVTIDNSFDISHNEHSLSVFNQPEIFQYLIQQQFDVFGWIKDKLALDKTKL